MIKTAEDLAPYRNYMIFILREGRTKGNDKKGKDIYLQVIEKRGGGHY